GSIVVPSGPGTIEPLFDVRIVVGTHGQKDVTLPGSTTSNGPATLRNRDSRSLYIKRWRYTQRLGSRATHEALIAAGEIEETEEGEEREDGEDGPPIDDDAKESVEDWPDPDNYTMEAEDALRRVCLVTSPVSLRWWTQMQMRPIGASKDIRWCAFVPPCINATLSASAGVEEENAALVHEWCRMGSAVAEWYLGDVDSAYQASHLGTHRPLGLNKMLDGVFTQMTESGAAGTLAGQAAVMTNWSARLLYDAERLGSCMAHAWYTTSQLEQQQQQQKNHSQSPQLSQLSQSQQQQQQQQNVRGAAESSSSSLAAAKTLVLYMMVPFSNQLALWLAMAEASSVAIRAFESTLQSLITRTASGIPSSTTTVSTNVAWPSLVVHPLPLDLLSEWHHGRRLESVPSAQETALAIYNRCPEFLSPPPPLATAHSAATVVGTASTPHSSATIGRQSRHATPATSASATQSAFVAAALLETRHLRANPRVVVASRAGSSRGGGGGQLARHSGYFVHVPDQPLPRRMQSFAHRAFVVSMPCSFPSSHAANSHGNDNSSNNNSCCVPATMALARTGTRTGTSTRSDIVSLGTEISTNVDAGRLSRVPSASTTAMAAFGSPRPSVYPSIPPTASTPAAASPAPNNKTLVSDTNEPVSSFSSLTAVNRGDEDVSVELEETR
ncbi:hypothetical protein J3B02_004493, partial [Coemansia erecta]